MGDFLKSAFGQKVIGTILGVGLLVVAHQYPQFAAEIGALAGTFGIGVHAWHAEPPGKNGVP